MNQCKGLWFRGKVNSFINKKGEYIYKETMTPLKRESCPGCISCDYLREAFISEEFGKVELGDVDSDSLRDIAKFCIARANKLDELIEENDGEQTKGEE